MSTLDEMEMPTLTFDPAPEPKEKAPVVPVQEEKAKLEKNGKNYLFHGADEELAAYLEDIRLGRRE